MAAEGQSKEVRERHPVRMMLRLVRSYPGLSALTVAAFTASALLDSIGIAFVLPLLAVIVGGGGGAETEPTGIEVAIESALAGVGIPATLEVMLLLLVGIMATKIVVGLAGALVFADAGARIGADMRRRLVRGLAGAEWNFFARFAGGAAATAMGTEVQRAQNAFIGSAKLFAALIRIVTMMALAVAVSWTVTVAAAVFGGALSYLLSFLVRITAVAGRRQTELQASLTAGLMDGITSIKPMKAMAREQPLVDLLDRETRALERVRRRLSFVLAAVAPIVEPLSVIALAIAAFVLLGPGTMRIESLMFLALLFTRSVGGIASLLSGYQTVVSNAAAFWYVEDLIRSADAAKEQLQGATPPQLASAIRFNQVSFSHTVAPDALPILHNASFEIRAHAITVIRGESGAGKTSLVDLLLGFYRPTSGRILIDGIDLASLDRRSWRRRVGYVSQELLLLNDTVRNNVTLGDPSIEAGDVQEALRLAGAAGFVSALRNGVETVVGERGSLLSGGQRQRVALARALVRRPDLLILDEVTASLDPATARQIAADLGQLASRTTIVAVTHQSELLEVAEQVLQLDRGAVEQVPDVMSFPQAVTRRP